jgi:CelD/BcsL family acetyltransferase involved in cellulose biosynthesis
MTMPLARNVGRPGPPELASDTVAVPAARELSLADPGWRNFVSSHPEALAFHRPEWAELLAECYGYRPFALAQFDSAGRIVGGLPVLETKTFGRRRWLALPFTDRCPPLLSPFGDPATFTRALEQARRVGGCALDVRAPLPGAYLYGDAVLHRTELEPDADSLFARFHRSQVQRNVRRAERERVVVRRAESRTDLTRSFYRLQVETRRRLGMPAQPRRFFDALWDRLLEPGFGFLLLAYAGTEPVAGGVFLLGSDTVAYKYGASDAAFWRLRPNHLVFWTAMRSACEQGYRWFDFGRSDLPDRGLRDFKAGWAAEEEPLYYTMLADDPRTKARSGRALATARAVLRRSPTWVCRASGELLYRYAA